MFSTYYPSGMVNGPLSTHDVAQKVHCIFT